MKRTVVFPIVFIIILSVLFSFLNGFAGPTLAQEPVITPGPVDSGEPISPDNNVPPEGTGADGTGLDFNSTLGGGCAIPGAGWVIKTPMAQAIYGMGIVSDNRYVYVVGGITSSFDFINAFSRYDPVLDGWSTLTPMPIEAAVFVAVYAEGKIYVFGGNNGSAVINDVHIYDILTDTWTDGQVMPQTRQLSGGGYYNGKIYIVGGYQGDSYSSARNQTWEYTIATNSWASKANLPNSLGGPGSGVVNGRLYIFGGANASMITQNSAYQYDIAGNSWSAAASLPAAVNVPGSAVYGERVWIFGGGNPTLGEAVQSAEDIEAVNTTYIYDPATNSWQNGPLQNIARSFQGGAVVINRIISIGGLSGGVSNVVEVLTQNPLKILIVYADEHVVPASLRWQLITQPGVGQVDVFDGESDTPTLSLLYNYDIVVPFSNTIFADPTALGDALADYQDMGGIVVGLAFDWYSVQAIAGRWVSGGYSPFNQTSSYTFENVVLGSFTSGHPLMVGVSVLNVYYHLEITPAPGATTVAYWSDGQSAIAFKGHAVGINAYLGNLSDNWYGHFARVIADAGKWLWWANSSCNAMVCNAPKYIEGSIIDADPTQTGRIFRVDPTSACSVSKGCSLNDLESHHYDAYPFWNNTGDSQCVTVTVDPKACGLNVQSAAYLGSYNPASTCTNYLGDIGGTTPSVKSYSFIVPAWSPFTVVVNEVYVNTFCPAYALSISAGDCPIINIENVLLPVVRR